MAAGAFVYHAAALGALATKKIDLEADEFFMLLTTSDYVPDDEADIDLDDVTDELSGGDYARETLTSVSATLTGKTVVWTSAPADFGAEVDIAAKYGVIINNTTTPKYIMGHVDLNSSGGSATSTAGPFKVSPHATNGWWRHRPPS
ncbi:hypothetical protein STVA_41380 [Allostella vacuolata]|nr:hypothetical protein STVA_41380 [Stella vacuolata]